MTDQPTIGDMIAKANELKAYVEAEDDAHKERMKPYREGIRALETTCGVLLQQQGLQNYKAEDGTAYLKHNLSVKVDNRQDFLNFILEDFEDRNKFLDAGVLKDPVRDWLAKYEQNPPGIVTVPSVQCIIRK